MTSATRRAITAMLAGLFALSPVAHAADSPAPPDVAAPGKGARKSASGLTSLVLRRGQGRAHPRPNDCVRIHYVGWHRDGQQVANSRRQPEPEVQCLRRMSAGAAEAVTAMVVGEQRRIWVPARLNTGPGRDDEAPPPVDATYDLELYAIIAAPPTPRDLAAPPRTATRTPSGVAVQVLARGRGDVHPDPGTQVIVQLSGWKADGVLFESTAMSEHPATFVVREMLPGLRDAVQTMTVGQRARVWIPAALGYGDKPRRGQPGGPLVFDVELLEMR
jgi:peptidylprolyl isomerase